jgi:hypothetical protein
MLKSDQGFSPPFLPPPFPFPEPPFAGKAAVSAESLVRPFCQLPILTVGPGNRARRRTA